MVQTIKLKCSHCGAPLNATPEDSRVVCEYCKHVSFLHRPGQTAEASRPVAHQKTGSARWLVLVGAVIVLVIAGGATFFLARQVNDAVTSALPGGVGVVTALKQAAPLSKVRFSDQPQLSDLDGDGAPEIIGLSTTTSGEAYIAAYDGRTLEPRWKTALLGPDAKAPNALRAVVPGLVLASDALGKLQAYSDKTGQPVWATLIGERVKSFCLGQGFVRVLSADKKTHDLALDTGKRLAEPSPSNPPKGRKKGSPWDTDCVPVQGTRGEEGPVSSLIGWSDFDDYDLPSIHGVEGISAHRALVLRGTSRAFLLGSKSSGTSYPMVAAVDGRKLLWIEPVSGSDPMASTSNVTTQLAAFSDDKLAIPYEVRNPDGTRMALFETQSGKRLWDMPIHQKNHVESGMTMTKDTIYYASWSGVYLIDVATGNVRAFLGQEF